MSPAVTTLLMVIAVAVIALVMRSFSRDRTPAAPRPADSVEALLAEVSGGDSGEESGEDSDTPEGVVAITSDGWAFVPDGGEVQLIPPASHDEDLALRPADAAFDVDRLGSQGGPFPRTQRPVSSWKVGEHIDHGDLAGVRVKRGAPDFDPWRLEAIGRDGDYRAWFFETEEAARAALELLERVVRPPRDEYGEADPPGPEDFDAARRLDEETEQALDHHDDE